MFIQNSCLLRTKLGFTGLTLLLSIYLSFSLVLNSDKRTLFTERSDTPRGERDLIKGGLGGLRDLGEPEDKDESDESLDVDPVESELDRLTS